ncbi:hypothetical protein CLU79DRAFT_749194 [Phycomyces nitens]|nr:hypothetical protein CLU79DRAFT_749194 [Phycomyces nitens]
MAFGYLEKFIPFKSSVECNAQYAAIDRGFNIGKVLKDIVELVKQGPLYQNEPRDPKENDVPLIGIDQIYMNISSTPCDYKLTGYVTHTKNNLMVYYVTLEAVDKLDFATGHSQQSYKCLGVPSPGIVAIFSVTLGILDPSKGCLVAVDQIKCVTPREKYLFDQLGKVQISRQRLTQKMDGWKELDLDNNDLVCQFPPSILESFYSDSNSPGFTFISNTMVESNLVAVAKQDGYIVQSSYDLACLGASNFLRSFSFCTTKVNQVTFAKPIMAGELVHTTARIVYSNQNGHFTTLVVVKSKAVKELDYTTAVVMHVSFVSLDPNIQIRLVMPLTFRDKLLWHNAHEMAYQKNDHFRELIDEIGRTERTCKL